MWVCLKIGDWTPMFVATLMWKRMTDLIDPQNSGTRFSDKPTFKSLGATDKNDTKGGTGSLWRINFNPSVPWFSDVASMDTKILRKRKKEIWKPLFAQIRSKRFFWCPLSFNNSKIQQSLPQAQYDRHPRLPSCLSPQSTSTSLQPWLVQTTGFALSWSAGLSCWNPLELP